MKNFKKIALALGTVATVVTPIAAVVSCGSSHKKDKAPVAAKPTTAPSKQHKSLGKIKPITGEKSAFHTEAALTTTINNGDINTILASLKGLTLTDAQGLVSSMTTDGTKKLLKAIVAQATKVSTNVLPFVDSILGQLKIDASISNVIKEVRGTESLDKLLDLLGSQVGDILNEEIDKLVTDDLIKDMKTQANKYLTKSYFETARSMVLNNLNYDSLEDLGKSIFDTAKDKIELIKGLVKTVPQLQLLVNFLDPASTPVEKEKTYRLEFTPGNTMRIFESTKKMDVADAIKSADAIAAGAPGALKAAKVDATAAKKAADDAAKAAGVAAKALSAKPNDKALQDADTKAKAAVAKTKAAQESADKDLVAKTAAVTEAPKTAKAAHDAAIKEFGVDPSAPAKAAPETAMSKALKSLFGTDNMQTLAGGSSPKLNRIMTTVFTIFGKFDAKTLVDIKTLFQEKMHFTYTLQEDWESYPKLTTQSDGTHKFVGTKLPKGTKLNINQFDQFFASGKMYSEESASSFRKAIYKYYGLLNDGYVKDSTNPEEKYYRNFAGTGKSALKNLGHWDDASAAKNPLDPYKEVDAQDKIVVDKGTFSVSRDFLKGSDTKMGGVDLTKYGFKNVEEYASIFANSSENSAEHTDNVPGMLSEIGMALSVSGFDSSNSNFGASAMSGVLGNSPKAIKYLEGLADALGIESKGIDSEVNELNKQVKETKQVSIYKFGFDDTPTKNTQVTKEIYDKYNANVDKLFKTLIKDIYDDLEGKIPAADATKKTAADAAKAAGVAAKALSAKPNDKALQDADTKAKAAAKTAADAADTASLDSVTDIMKIAADGSIGTDFGKVVTANASVIDSNGKSITPVIEKIKTWLNKSGHGDFEKFYSTVIEASTREMKDVYAAHQIIEVGTDVQFAILKKLAEAIFSGAKNVLGTQDVDTKTGKGLLE